MRRALLIGMVVGLAACRGPAGSNGSNGTNGPSYTIYNGVLNSNTFVAYCPALNDNSVFQVYLIDVGGNKTELPFWSPLISANVDYLQNGSNVTIYNALAIGVTRYEIAVENEPGGMSLIKR